MPPGIGSVLELLIIRIVLRLEEMRIVPGDTITSIREGRRSFTMDLPHGLPSSCSTAFVPRKEMIGLLIKGLVVLLSGHSEYLQGTLRSVTARKGRRDDFEVEDQQRRTTGIPHSNSIVLSRITSQDQQPDDRETAEEDMRIIALHRSKKIIEMRTLLLEYRRASIVPTPGIIDGLDNVS